jgi:hypothetical protein
MVSGGGAGGDCSALTVSLSALAGVFLATARFAAVFLTAVFFEAALVAFFAVVFFAARLAAGTGASAASSGGWGAGS